MINYVKFVRGTPAQYQALIHKDADTLYFICEEDESSADLYLGTKLIAAADTTIQGAMFLSQLQDVLISEGLAHDNVLVYDAIAQSWVNKPIEEALSVFIGATEVSRGKAGLVPVPKAGQHKFFLKGDGTWSYLSTDDIEVAASGLEAPTSQTLTAVISHLQEQLDAAITEENLRSAVEEELAAASLINSVSSDFIIDENKQLNLNTLSISQIEGLEDRLASVGEWKTFS